MMIDSFLGQVLFLNSFRLLGEGQRLFLRLFFLKNSLALADMAQWIEHQPAKVTGSIPSQSTCLSCRPGPQLGACERQPLDVISHTLMFLSFSFPSSLSKSE